jgi:sulfite reductase (NADPH) hemoprotein beta-component
LVKNDAGETGFKILVGGGLGRTPIIGQVIKPYLEKRHLLSYLEAILRIYNLFGRRDNMYKARIKILLKESGMDKFSDLVENEWELIKNDNELSTDRIDAIKAYFNPPDYEPDAAEDKTFEQLQLTNKSFASWVRHNVAAHKVPGYQAVFISLKAPDSPPGDMTDSQLDAVANLADQYSFGQIRITHRQNLVLADVRQSDLFTLWQQLDGLKLATPNIGTVTDIICCPGLDFCSLANAGSIGITKEINQALDDMDYIYDIGDLKINISGCMNGCAHQSVGHIGILGVDKNGTEWYQLTLGGSSENEAAIGDRLGPAVAKDQVVNAITTILDVYVKHRQEDESFLEMVNRVGISPFKEQVYASH